MNFISKYFNFEKRGASFKGEIIGGLTTFITMSYVLFVNPDILGAAGMNKSSVFVATALAAAVGTLIMGIYAKFPMALAPGMGLNAFFAFTVCGEMGVPWEVAISGVLVSGIIFIIISVTGLRELIIKAIPQNLKYAVSAGIGLFIAFVGLKGSGIIVADASTLVKIGDLTNPKVLLAVFGLLVTAILLARKVKIAIFIGMVCTVIAGVVFGLIGTPDAIVAPIPSLEPTFGVAIKNLGQVFNPQMLMVVFTMLFMDFFDTAGTLVAVGSKVGLVKEDGSIENGSKALLSDSVATCVGAVFGTTNTTSYIESLSGASVGARTGFSSVIVAGMFGLSMFFSPLLSVVTSEVTAPALIIVGSLMCSSLADINWKDPEIAIPAFLTIILMPLSYSIAIGIAFGFCTYVVLMMFKGKFKEIHPVMYTLAALFTFYFAFGVA
ncbi:NCS2 family permease [Clostridium sardiniense]|uniref:NCS2 family permease n=1 Tax=Clostridium sardiniense TaxID=29369 RepID=UPI003D33E7FC